MTSHSNLSPVCLPPAIGILAFWGGVVAVCSCCAPFADILQLHHNYLLVTPSSLSLSFFASLFTRSFSIWRFMVRTSSLCVTSSWPCGFFCWSVALLYYNDCLSYHHIFVTRVSYPVCREDSNEKRQSLFLYSLCLSFLTIHLQCYLSICMYSISNRYFNGHGQSLVGY